MSALTKKEVQEIRDAHVQLVTDRARMQFALREALLRVHGVTAEGADRIIADIRDANFDTLEKALVR